MSLLMDALRRAEQEKKAAAENLREKEDSLKDGLPNKNKLSLTPIDDDSQQQDESHTTPIQEDTGDDTSHHLDPDATIAEARENLELTPTDENTSTGEDNADYIDYTPTSGRLADSHTDNDISLEGDVDHLSYELRDSDGSDEPPTLAVDEDSDEDQTKQHDNFTIDMSGEAGDDTLASSGDGTDDTVILENRTHKTESEESPESDDTLESTRTHNDFSGHHQFRERGTGSQPRDFSQVSAQNIFAARRRPSQTTITVVLLVLLIAIGLTAAGVFYYYSVTPATRQFVSPRVAEGIANEQTDNIDLEAKIESESMETPGPLSPPSEYASVDDASGVVNATTGKPASEKATNTGSSDEQVPEQQPAKETSSSPSEQQFTARQAPRSEQTDPNNNKNEESASGAESASVGSVSADDEALELRPALVKISRSKSSANLSQTVTQAYEAYGRGNLAQARQLYQKVLDSDSGNRNALLGLGAIAVRENRFDSAYKYYGDLLRQNPSDRAARAALISMQRQADPATSEAHIKRLLEQEPEAAYLYQALGHVYARSQRWPQAQQAYFDAFSRDSDNADYAFNLAVSLDQLNQPNAALEYYNKALELAASQSISFKRTTAQDRVREIRNGSNPQ